MFASKVRVECAWATVACLGTMQHKAEHSNYLLMSGFTPPPRSHLIA